MARSKKATVRAKPTKRTASRRKTKRAVANSDNVRAAVEWYKGERSLYEQLAKKVEDVIREVVESQQLPHLTITSRAKSSESYLTKASGDEYTDPKKQMKDMAGIRIICYVDTEAASISKVVEGLFEVDPEHSTDPSARLGVDRMGYRSTHFLCRFNADRCKIEEFKKFRGREFEVQVRTVLQHAWAEIEHDRNYKFSGVLPEEIQRRFAVLAGVLELSDREFSSIAAAIDAYSEDVASKTKEGDLDISVNSTSLQQYLRTRFETSVNAGLEDDISPEAVEEVRDFGISNLAELDRIIPQRFPQTMTKFENKADEEGHSNFTSMLRSLMMIEDEERYFNDCWKKRFNVFHEPQLLEEFGVDVESRSSWMEAQMGGKAE